MTTTRFLSCLTVWVTILACSSAPPAYHEGQELEKRREMRAAIRAYERAIVDAPDFKDAYDRVVDLYMRFGTEHATQHAISLVTTYLRRFGHSLSPERRRTLTTRLLEWTRLQRDADVADIAALRARFATMHLNELRDLLQSPATPKVLLPDAKNAIAKRIELLSSSNCVVMPDERLVHLQDDEVLLVVKACERFLDDELPEMRSIGHNVLELERKSFATLEILSHESPQAASSCRRFAGCRPMTSSDLVDRRALWRASRGTLAERKLELLHLLDRSPSPKLRSDAETQLALVQDELDACAREIARLRESEVTTEISAECRSGLPELVASHDLWREKTDSCAKAVSELTEELDEIESFAQRFVAMLERDFEVANGSLHGIAHSRADALVQYLTKARDLRARVTHLKVICAPVRLESVGREANLVQPRSILALRALGDARQRLIRHAQGSISTCERQTCVSFGSSCASERVGSKTLYMSTCRSKSGFVEVRGPYSSCGCHIFDKMVTCTAHAEPIRICERYVRNCLEYGSTCDAAAMRRVIQTLKDSR